MLQSSKKLSASRSYINIKWREKGVIAEALHSF